MTGASAVADLGELLRARGYSEQAQLERLGVRPDGFVPHGIPLYERRLDSADPLAPLFRLFLFNLPLSAAEAATAVAPLDVDALAAAGLLERRGDTVVAPLRLGLYRHLILAHDTDSQPDRADFVLGPGPTARSLANLTIRRPVRTALDVGSGAGVQALLAAAHADHVVGVDTNARALELAAINAALNGVANVEWRRGSLFEPVDGERFDLIVCNPPFVISPSREFEFRDGGFVGDEMSRVIAASTPDFLTDGGLGFLLCNWVVAGDESWHARPQSWLADRGCDAVTIFYGLEDPLTYAARWHESIAGERDRYAAALDRWTEYYAQLGIEKIATGAIALRRRRGTTRSVVVDASATPGDRAGPQLDAIFDAGPRRADDTDGLLDAVLRPAPGLGLQQQLSYDTEFSVGTAAFFQPAGVGVLVSVAPIALHVVLALDGSTPLRALIEQAAEEGELDHDELAGAVLEAVAPLLAYGLVCEVDGRRA